MRKIIVQLAMTLDGYIEGPNGEIDWLVRDEATDFGDILSDILSDKDIIMYGRVSYDKWGNYQPGENLTQRTKDAYKLLHSKQKYVFSNSKKQDQTNAIFINRDIKARVLEIKRQAGKNIWLYGGAKTVSSFLNLDLIDEYRLAVHPVLLGKGKPLFENLTSRRKLILTDVRAHKSGVTLLKYRTDGATT
jgi:dihydrofolate reductase